MEMPFDQITVSSLSRRCEISPNTFYYHYQDIHDLLDYWLRTKMDQELALFPESLPWNERVRRILTLCKENERLIFHISDSNARAHLERYVFETSKAYVLDAVDERLGKASISDARRHEMASLLQFVFLGFFIRFLWNKMQNDIDASVEWLDQQFCFYVRQAASDTYRPRS